MNRDCVAMICGTVVVVVALVLDGTAAVAMAAGFVGAGGFLAGYKLGSVN